MSSINFTLQDLVSTFIAFVLFPIIYVIPGYVIGWLFELFDFRKRIRATRFVIAIVISIAISPIITFLTWNLISVKATFIMLGVFIFAFIIIVAKTKRRGVSAKIKRIQSVAISAAGGWSILSILSLIDIQWGNRLYYNVVSYDFTTRAAIINAMTRTGVPPINPSYYPGHPIRLTYLYYFWYIPCSLVSQMGGPWVSGRTAMIASVVWCGLGLMATIGLYLRLRNPENGLMAWKAGLLGSGLLLISGLDFIPALILIINSRLTNGYSVLEGDIEHWNEQITAWVGALSWIPHHVAALIACIVAILLTQSARGKSVSRQLTIMTFAGLAFGSAVGLSIFVTGVFVVFWGIWMIIIFLQKERNLSLTMGFAGLVALIASSPFLKGLIGGATSFSNSAFPFTFAVRIFRPIVPYVLTYPSSILNFIFLLLLPISYLLELGFFFIAGLLWIQQFKKANWINHPYHSAEIILLTVTFIIGSFVRSTVIGSNDLGWRAWLSGQFILLIWGVDVIIRIFPDLKIRTLLSLFSTNQQNWNSLRILLILGFITSVVDVTLLRVWPGLVDSSIAGFPNSFSTDRNLGQRTFAAREAYEFINKNTPDNIHIQENPTGSLNRPIGLYANRPIAISGQTVYGISQQDFYSHADLVGKIFMNDTSWDEIDKSCNENFIDVIAVSNEDPLWRVLPTLEVLREPLYKNQYYGVFSCGKFANP